MDHSDTPAKESINKTAYETHPIHKTLASFLSHLEHIREAALIAPLHLANHLKIEIEKSTKELRKFVAPIEEDVKEIKFITRNMGDVAAVTKLISKINKLQESKASSIVLESLFTQIFAEFDSFTGRLLREIYTRKQDLLKGIERQINLSTLLEYNSITELQDDILSQEIDSFRRDSYIQQFSNLEKKFSLKLRGFNEWGEFVEISQRRNLLIHNGGHVSEQYIIQCEKEGYAQKVNPKLGDRLNVDASYISRAIFLMEKIGFMLTHSLWRKIFPEEMPMTHSSANTTLYQFLSDMKWESAAEIGKFSLTPAMIKSIDEIDYHIRVINVAIGVKFSTDNQTKVDEILTLKDWSASYRDFQLATCVLQDKFDEASNLMKKIGKNGELVNEYAYHKWPLFHKFRESENFSKCFKEIYEIDFSVSSEIQIQPPKTLTPKKKAAVIRKKPPSKNPDQ